MDNGDGQNQIEQAPCGHYKYGVHDEGNSQDAQHPKGG